jgi:hypothetical protein
MNPYDAVPLEYCDVCGHGAIVIPIYRSQRACSVLCMDAIDRHSLAFPTDPVTATVDDWCSRLPRSLRALP